MTGAAGRGRRAGGTVGARLRAALRTPPLSRAAFARLEPALRNRLLDAQFEFAERSAAGLMVLATGLPAAGRTETVARLVEWLDPKLVSTHALPRTTEWSAPSARWWTAVPARGRTSLVYGGWIEDLWECALRGGLEGRALSAACADARAFEALLRAERVSCLKLHFHVTPAEQQTHLEELDGDPATAWRITREDRWYAAQRGRVERIVLRVLAATDHRAAPWRVLHGADDERRELEAGRALAAAYPVAPAARGAARRGRASAAGSVTRAATPGGAAAARRRLQVADLPSAAPVALPGADPDRERERLQGRFATLVRSRAGRERALVVVFEGMDAAGKSGCIRRLTGALDPRQYRVIAVGAPTPEELAYPYLWRFWRHARVPGGVTIYDRSWYGRVLVERVRKLAAPADWARAYGEIRDFERGLTDRGAVLVKLWLAVGRSEQLRRFREREATPHQRFKVDPRDWQNRRLWPEYTAAAREAFARTGDWTVVPADDKRHARLAVLRTVCTRLARALGRDLD